MNIQWWLAELDRYGNAKLADGPHEDRTGVERARYILNRLGLARDSKFACAEVRLTEVAAISHGTNEDALNTLNDIGLKP